MKTTLSIFWPSRSVTHLEYVQMMFISLTSSMRSSNALTASSSILSTHDNFNPFAHKCSLQNINNNNYHLDQRLDISFYLTVAIALWYSRGNYRSRFEIILMYILAFGFMNSKLSTSLSLRCGHNV